MNGEEMAIIKIEIKHLADAQEKYNAENTIAHDKIFIKLEEGQKLMLEYPLSKDTFWNFNKIFITALLVLAGTVGTLWAYVIKLNGG